MCRGTTSRISTFVGERRAPGVDLEAVLWIAIPLDLDETSGLQRSETTADLSAGGFRYSCQELSRTKLRPMIPKDQKELLIEFVLRGLRERGRRFDFAMFGDFSQLRTVREVPCR